MNPIGMKVCESDIKNLFGEALKNRRLEHIMVCGTYRNRITYFKDISITKGESKNTKTKCSFNLANAVKELKASGAARFWICHNHLDIIFIPSKNDVESTKKFRRKANENGMRFMEHWILYHTGGGKYGMFGFKHLLNKT